MKGAAMAEDQSRKTEKKRSTPGYIATMGAGATVLAIINMSVGNGNEAPSQAVLILEYAALALGVFALVGGLIMMLAQKPE